MGSASLCQMWYRQGEEIPPVGIARDGPPRHLKPVGWATSQVGGSGKAEMECNEVKIGCGGSDEALSRRKRKAVSLGGESAEADKTRRETRPQSDSGREEKGGSSHRFLLTSSIAVAGQSA